MILMGVAFLGISTALIVLQPGSRQARDSMAGAAAPTAVTRAAATPDSFSRTASPDVAPRVNADVSSVLAALVREPQQPAERFRADAQDNPALAITAAIKASQQPQDGDLAQTTRAIVAELNRFSSRGAEDAALLTMTQGVLSKLSGATIGDSGTAQGRLRALVAQSLRAGQSDAYLDAVLNEARDSGQLVVHEALITSNGKVDTTTLLASLVQRSLVQRSLVQRSVGVAPSAVVASPPRVRSSGQTETYIVQPGDSLAAISYRYYGDTLRYTVIFDANRDKISAPDKIRIGQKLAIPVL
ncbi:LysM peptidoglycan-binding domain-containing protein [Antarctobacter jejuensis]|uniref:LysM peptidoglycan-binding domain-containing protein n=1 Tax=Antarctobacter jejuensis TaxID=1439938 RepID=UPI003FD3898F